MVKLKNLEIKLYIDNKVGKDFKAEKIGNFNKVVKVIKEIMIKFYSACVYLS